MRAMQIDHEAGSYWNPLHHGITYAATLDAGRTSSIGEMKDHLMRAQDVLLVGKQFNEKLAAVTEVNRTCSCNKSRLWVRVRTEEVTEQNLRLLWCTPIVYGIHTRFVQDLSSNGIIFIGGTTVNSVGFTPDIPPSVCITQYNAYCLHMLGSGMSPMAFDKFLGKVGELSE